MNDKSNQQQNIIKNTEGKSNILVVTPTIHTYIRMHRNEKETKI